MKRNLLILALCLLSGIVLADGKYLTLWVKCDDWNHPAAAHDRGEIKQKLSQITGYTNWNAVCTNMVVWVDSATNEFYVTNLDVSGRHFNITLAQAKAWAIANLDYPNKINWDTGASSRQTLIDAGLTPKKVSDEEEITKTDTDISDALYAIYEIGKILDCETVTRITRKKN